MSHPEQNTVFVEIMSPVFPLLKEQAGQLEKDALTYKLSFYFFCVESLVCDYQEHQEHWITCNRYTNFT